MDLDSARLLYKRMYDIDSVSSFIDSLKSKDIYKHRSRTAYNAFINQDKKDLQTAVREAFLGRNAHKTSETFDLIFARAVSP